MKLKFLMLLLGTANDTHNIILTLVKKPSPKFPSNLYLAARSSSSCQFATLFVKKLCRWLTSLTQIIQNIIDQQIESYFEDNQLMFGFCQNRSSESSLNGMLEYWLKEEKVERLKY